ncbi:hypothetical protein BDA96_04G368100 [Sorghum bicolor]|uniref:Uncharacterized protein n=2 Tax=Sorghum bicolor TaxID=4558 RepID=A0A921RA26_SORBI|nr:haloacid dehalogenase-like hydrolase domain-containing protein At2g33255 isoform X2 [Sorghum bicolor]KAG0535461.1 hypothetical protein BDA96_04G368100 [Sorghum bicolor]OQU85944.1 hypothetical protein SORBI_3004G344000 [Sorghum bicolor]|eukprot:XP_021313948.1 haloacid dehalogenase-like hydrolase domain-containing protein At2g33255 isoform X2 [Sorghum bicolor]
MLPRLLLGPHRLLLGGPLAATASAAPLPRRRAVAGRRVMSASAAPAPGPRRRPLRGVVFDMDGTLTVPVIDFQAMYREVLGGDAAYAAARAAGGGAVDILHCIEDWAPDKQRHAYEVIARFEQEGLDRLQIMPGASELCGFLDAKQIRKNSTNIDVVQLFVERLIVTSLVYCVYQSGYCCLTQAIQFMIIVEHVCCVILKIRGLITRNVKDAVDLFHQRFGMMFTPALSREFRPYKPDPAPLLHICSTWNIPPHEVIMVGDSLKDDVSVLQLIISCSV